MLRNGAYCIAILLGLTGSACISGNASSGEGLVSEQQDSIRLWPDTEGPDSQRVPCVPIECVRVPVVRAAFDGVALGEPDHAEVFVGIYELSVDQWVSVRNAYTGLSPEDVLAERINDVSRWLAWYLGDRAQAVAKEFYERAYEEHLPDPFVTVADAHEFCAQFTKVTGVPVRLPSLNEWNAISRCNVESRYWWGDELDDHPGIAIQDPGPTVAVMSELLEMLQPVDAGVESPCGIYNAFGNVAELVWPTDGERQSIRMNYGPSRENGPSGPGPIFYDDNRFALPQYAALLLGGSVSDPRELFERYATSISRVLLLRTASGTDDGWLCGIRLVVEDVGRKGDFEPER